MKNTESLKSIDRQKLNLLNTFSKAGINGLSEFASATRQDALAAIERLQVPTRKEEAWKYTSLKEVLKDSYGLPQQANVETVNPFLIPGLEAELLVFVNGRYSKEYSKISENLPFRIFDFASLKHEAFRELEAYFGKAANPDLDIFTALNTAYASQGTIFVFPQNSEAERPIYILHVLDSSERIGVLGRNLFVAEKGASAKIVEHFVAEGEATSLRNQLTEVFVAEQANLEYIKLQEESASSTLIDRTEVKQEQNSVFSIFTLSFGGKTIKNSLRISLDGEHIESNLMGTYALGGVQHLDNHTEVLHKKANCESNEMYKGIIDEQSTSSFSGKIHVYRDAQKTNAFQSNRNIVLTDTANSYSRPQLEIYADDVKCSHGATTGKLEESAMFYLRARGIKEVDARRLLIGAFIGEVTEQISIESVQDYITRLVENRW